MNTIDILIEGYAKITDTGWEASSTTTLITCTNGVISSEGEKSPQGISRPARDDKKENAIRIIVDPGANRDLLFEKLQQRGLSLEDIDFVFITHHHLDHAMNVGLFPNAKVVDGEAVYTQAVAVEGVSMLPDTDITVMATPGHEYAHGVLIVPTKEGTVVVAGDNFWWSEGDEQTVDVNKKDEFAENMEELIKSRKMILDLANWVIPGHGKMFANERT